MIAATFASVRRVWAATSPRCTYSPVAGSTGPCPETWTNGPLRTPCGKACAGAGAAVVRTAVLVIISPRSEIGGDHVQDAELLVDHESGRPLVEQGARVGDAEGDHVPGMQRVGLLLCDRVQVGVLVVQPGHLPAGQRLRRPPGGVVLESGLPPRNRQVRVARHVPAAGGRQRK